MKIRVAPVEGWRGVGEFLAVANHIYRNDPRWAAPPDLYQRLRLDIDREPFWRRGERALFVARQAGRAVGRVMAFRDHGYEKAHDDRTAFFGLFEAVDSEGVARALLDAASGWAVERGFTRLRGPIAFSMLETVGLLTDSFDRPARIATPYNPAYYPKLVEGSGFSVAREFASFEWKAWDLARPPRRGPPDLRLFPLDPEDTESAAAHFVAVYNEAMRKTFGFSPVFEDEIAALIEQVLLFGDPRLMWFATVSGEPAGLLAALPDLNESLSRSKGGLFALAKALYLRRGLRGARIFSMCVREKFRSLGLTGQLVYHARQAALEAGVIEAEISPVDLSYRSLVQLLEHAGTTCSKRYRLYERTMDT